MGPLTLVASENTAVKAACDEAARTGERVNVPVSVKGFCEGKQPVITAKATLSIKRLK